MVIMMLKYVSNLNLFNFQKVKISEKFNKNIMKYRIFMLDFNAYELEFKLKVSLFLYEKKI